MLVFWGCLEVPDVNQVQQGLQDVPRHPDCVWREVRHEEGTRDKVRGCEQGAHGLWRLGVALGPEVLAARPMMRAPCTVATALVIAPPCSSFLSDGRCKCEVAEVGAHDQPTSFPFLYFVSWLSSQTIKSTTLVTLEVQLSGI